MNTIVEQFTKSNRDRNIRRTRSFRPSIDGLEHRQVLSTVAANPTMISMLSDLNSQVVSFAQSHLHQKVGGGECAHLANEALRVAGANFNPTDPTHTGDYVWGSLVTTITAGRDSSSNTFSRPGDIIQFQNVSMKGGWSAQQHTAIVAAVDSHGRPTQVFEQNVGINGKGKGAGTHDRTDRLDNLTINASTVNAGTVHIYRPVSRTNAPGQLQFSLVNNTSSTQTVTMFFNGRPLSPTMSMTSFNTQASYLLGSVPGSGNFTLGINGRMVPLTNAGAYEVFTSNGQTSIHAI